MKFMRQYLLSLLLTFAMASGAFAAADLGNTSIISPTDASNGSGTCPSWLGSAAPSTIDDAGRCLQGAIAREWQNRSFAVTSTGSADAYVVAYSVAPAAYRSGQVYSFITNFTVAGTATVNINSLGAKTIKKDVAGTLTALASGDMSSGQFVMLAYNGTDMIWVNWQGAGGTASTTTQQLTGTSTAVLSTPDSVAALWEAGSDVADGAAITIGEGGYFNLITSTTAITSFSVTTDKAGRSFKVRFNTARTLTHNATSLIIPGGANITTAAGDIAGIRSLGSGNVVVEWYTKASGAALVGGGIAVVRRQVFTAGGTYTPDANLLYASVIVTGGGGGGGGADADASNTVGVGGGGGAGGTARKIISAATIGASQTVTIGAAGTAGSGTNGTNGGTGGNSSLGVLAVGNGGVGAVGSGVGGTTHDTGKGGIGGTATGGDTNASGGSGDVGIAFDDSTVSVGFGGTGGASIWGSGGTGGAGSSTTSLTSNAGAAGIAYGSGGGGGVASDTTGAAGGAGAAGYIEITEYCSQ